MGKTEMWNILKTVNRRTKQTKVWGSGYYSAHMEVTFDARFLELGVIWCILHNFQFLQYLKLFLSEFSSDFIQTLYKVS